MLVYRCLYGLVPQYLSVHIQRVANSNRRRLRSSLSSQLVIRRTRLSPVVDRAFPVTSGTVRRLTLPQLQRSLSFGIASKLNFFHDHFLPNCFRLFSVSSSATVALW